MIDHPMFDTTEETLDQFQKRVEAARFALSQERNDILDNQAASRQQPGSTDWAAGSHQSGDAKWWTEVPCDGALRPSALSPFSTLRTAPNWRHLCLEKHAGIPGAKAVMPGERSHLGGARHQTKEPCLKGFGALVACTFGPI